MPKYQRATVYGSQGHLSKAADLLEEVLRMAPREANAHFLLGKLYRRLKQNDKAIQHLLTALDLDPQSRVVIKRQIERVNKDDDSDDEGTG